MATWLIKDIRIGRQKAQADNLEPIKTGRFTLKENEIVCGDCRGILGRIKADTFHAVITDPCFGIGKVYKGRQEETDEPEQYWRWFEPVYREMLRVLKPGGFCAIFQGGRYFRHFWDWFGDQDFIVYAACREPGSAFKGGHPLLHLRGSVDFGLFLRGREHSHRCGPQQAAFRRHRGRARVRQGRQGSNAAPRTRR